MSNQPSAIRVAALYQDFSGEQKAVPAALTFAQELTKALSHMGFTHHETWTGGTGGALFDNGYAAKYLVRSFSPPNLNLENLKQTGVAIDILITKSSPTFPASPGNGIRVDKTTYKALKPESLPKLLRDVVKMFESYSKLPSVLQKQAGAFTEEAKIITEQLGGLRRVSVMLGIGSSPKYHWYNLTGAHGPGVGFTFPNKQSSKGNVCEIKLDASDTYTVSFFSVRNFEKKLVRKLSDIYADSLVTVFERQTGLYLHL